MWSEVRLRSLYHRVEESGRPDLPLLSVYRDHGVVLREGRDDNYNKPSADLSGYKIVRRNDLVINKMKAWQGSLGVSDHDGIVSPAYFIGRLIGDADSRFVHHLLRSSPLIAEYSSRSKGIRPSQWDLPWDEFASIKVHLPTLDEQRRLASYIDTETASIDAFISKRRRLAELLDERSQALHDEWYERLSSAFGLVPIRRLIHYVEQGWSPVCDSEPASRGEWGVIRTSAVSSGRFKVEKNKRLPSTVERDRRWLLHDGDLLVTRGSGTRSKVGRACVASVGSRILTLSDLVYRVRLIQAQPEFVSASLQSSPVRAHIERSIRTDAGLTLKIRRDDLADVRIPAVPVGHHVSETTNLTRCLQPLRDTSLKIEKQLALLAERRQALITAAVTGKIQVSDVLV